MSDAAPAFLREAKRAVRCERDGCSAAVPAFLRNVMLCWKHHKQATRPEKLLPIQCSGQWDIRHDRLATTLVRGCFDARESTSLPREDAMHVAKCAIILVMESFDSKKGAFREQAKREFLALLAAERGNIATDAGASGPPSLRRGTKVVDRKFAKIQRGNPSAKASRASMGRHDARVEEPHEILTPRRRTPRIEFRKTAKKALNKALGKIVDGMISRIFDGRTKRFAAKQCGLDYSEYLALEALAERAIGPSLWHEWQKEKSQAKVDPPVHFKDPAASLDRILRVEKRA